MSSITITGSIEQINKVKNIFQSSISNPYDNLFTLFETGFENDSCTLQGVTNSNYEANGLLFLEEFKKACLQVFQEDDLIQK